MAVVDMSQLRQRYENLRHRLRRAIDWQLNAAQDELTKLAQSRMLQDPRRLYAAQAERLERLAKSYALQDPRRLYAAQEEKLARLMGSWAFQEPERLFAAKMQRLDMAFAQLVNLMQQRKQQAEHSLALNQAKLEAISPYAVFKRGYSCVHDSKRKIISSIDQVRWGDEITTSVKDGQIISVVQEVERR